MKKIAYSMAILLAACACTKEEAAIEETAAGKVTFAATMECSEGTDETKAQLSKDTTIVWNEGDSISILDISSSPSDTKFLLTSGAGETSAKFNGNCPVSGSGYYAVYPYSEKTYLDYSTYNYIPDLRWDGASQVAYDGNIDPAKHLMIAYGKINSDNTEIPLAFKNVLSYLKFKTEYKCKSVVIKTGADDDYIACEHLEVTVGEDGKPNIGQIIGRTDEITLTAPDGGIIEPGTYYVAILPRTYKKGFTLTFNSATKDGKSCTRESTKSSTFERNKIYNLGTIDLTEIYDLAGSGTESDPYLISDFYDLALMSLRVDNKITGYASAYYKQTKDIDCGGHALNPIGSKDVYFSGNYDGGEHKIGNVVYQCESISNTNPEGVFALFTAIINAKIRNLRIGKVRLQASLCDSKDVVSPIVGFALSKDGGNEITNCHVSDTTLWEMNNVQSNVYYGGIIGYNKSRVTIENCSHNVNVTFNVMENRSPQFFVGGIIGATEGENDTIFGGLDNSEITTVTKCRNTGNISIINEKGTVEQSYFGGILGKAEDYTFDDDVTCRFTACVNSGDLYMGTVDSDSFFGGIVGSMDSDGSGDNDPYLLECMNTGNMTASPVNLAGIAGYVMNSYVKIYYCVNQGKMISEQGSAIYSIYGMTTPTCKGCFTTVSCKYNKDCEVDENLSATMMNYTMGDDGPVKWYTTTDGRLELDF